jgi:hypothetical protein
MPASGAMQRRALWAVSGIDTGGGRRTFAAVCTEVCSGDKAAVLLCVFDDCCAEQSILAYRPMSSAVAKNDAGK